MVQFTSGGHRRPEVVGRGAPMQKAGLGTAGTALEAFGLI